MALVNRLVVQFHPEVPRSRIDSLAAAHGLELLRPPRPDSGSYEYWFRYPRRVADPLEIAISVGSNDAVMWADPDKVQDRRPQLVPSDAYYSSQWHLKSATSYNGIPVDINAESAWNLTTGSSAVRVAVIDDGVDALHASELLNAFSGANGYDLMAALSSGDGVFNPYGNDTHGTSIAGLIFARHGDGGVAGIAPGTRMNVARIFRRSYDLPQNRQTASDADIANAINWAWQSVASDVISNSWGGGAPSAAIDQAIVNATTLGRGGKGTVVVFSAGNHPAAQPNKPVTYPATHPSVIAVSAIGPSGTRASYSAQGNEVDIAALSGDLTGTCIGALVTIDLWSYDGCNDFPVKLP